MQAPATVLQAGQALVRDREESQNTHKSMLQEHYVSLSRLIKSTARDLIAEVLEDAPDEPGGEHWGDNGNALADNNLRRVPHQEYAVTVPIPGTEWRLDGHFDGGAFHDLHAKLWMPSDEPEAVFATVYEAKAPMHDYGQDGVGVETAYAQGLAYLAMMLQMHRAGVDRLKAAPWKPGPDLPLPTVLEPAQVVVCITPYDANRYERAFPVDQDTCNKHLEKLLEKAAVVVQGIEAGDPEVGLRDWDEVKKKGLGEFDRFNKLDVPVVTDEDLHAFLKRRAATKAALDESSKELDECNEALKRYLILAGEDKVKAHGCTFSLVRSKGGIRHFTVGPSTSIRVYGKPDGEV